MGLAPETFWSMSLGEWRAAVNGFTARHRRTAPPLARAEFEAMLQAHPDAGLANSGKGE